VLALFLLAALSGRSDVEAAISAYRASEYEQAQTGFEHALADATLGDSDRATLCLWLALVRADLYDDAGSLAYMNAAIALDADVKLPVAAAPRIAARLEEARATHAKIRAANPQPATTLAASPLSSSTAPSSPTMIAATSPPAVPAAAASSPESSVLPWAFGSAGAVMLAGAAGLSVVVAVEADAANDATKFASDRQSAATAANLSLAGAVTAGVLGATLVASGVYFGVTGT
jgi:hypothetical protein